MKTTKTKSIQCLFAFATMFLLCQSVQADVQITDTPAGGIYLDNSNTTRTFSVNTMFIVTEVTIEIDFEKYDGQTLGVNGGATPFYNEIVFTLTSPNATTVTLIAANSFVSGSTGFRGVIKFDQAALDVVNVNTASPSAGTFRPTGGGSLSDFVGQQAFGNWSLFMADTANADHMGYYSSTLSFVPEPSSMALLSVGLGALLLIRGRKAHA